MSKRTRVNIRSIANSAQARTETRNGREVMIVPSATLPDNIVMNDILYPADEIEASYLSLNGTPAPAGHPMIGNQFLSARDFQAINGFYIGATNENVRRENGRVLLDKVIDVEFANSREAGRRVLAAINAGDPIHTSTGLFLDLEDAPEGAGYKYIGRNMEFDHDAILLDQEGAATPDQGVGIFVNSSGQEIPVINSAIEWADRDLDWAVSSVLDALDRRERAGLVDRMKSALIEAFASMRNVSHTKENGMSTEKMLQELSAQVNGLAEAVTPEKIAEIVRAEVANAVKPMSDHIAQLQASAAAAEEAEKAELIAKIVKANLLDEETAKGLALNALKALAVKTVPGKAAGINAAFGGSSGGDEFADYDINALMEAK